MLATLLPNLAPLALPGWLAMAPPTPPHKTKVYLIGDSTMAQKAAATFPETGWSMPLVTFFDTTIVVDNRAQNGRSTRTFLAENRWQPVVSALQPGDETSKLLFRQLTPGDHPNYPLGRTDNTHFNELGARKMAQLVVHDLQAQHAVLVEEHLANPLPKNAVAAPTGAASQSPTP